MSRKPPMRETIAVNSKLMARALDLKLDVVRAAEAGIDRAIQDEKERLWRLENAEGFEAANDWVARNGLPLNRFRTF